MAAAMVCRMPVVAILRQLVLVQYRRARVDAIVTKIIKVVKTLP